MRNIQMQPMKTVRSIAYLCTERTFDSRMLLYDKIFLKNFNRIFTHLLAYFATKLVNYLKHSEPLKYVLKSTISCLRRNMSSISEFYWMFKESLWREYVCDQFWRKRCQKKRKDVEYKLHLNFFQKCFVVWEHSAVKVSFSTYVCYALDGFHWSHLYVKRFKSILSWCYVQLTAQE